MDSSLLSILSNSKKKLNIQNDRIMRKQFYSSIAALLFIPSAFAQLPSTLVPRDLPTMKPDSAVTMQTMNKVEQKLGNSVWSALLEVNKVEAYRLDGHQVDTTENGLAGFKVLEGSVLLSDAQRDTLIHQLQSEVNYYFDNFSKSCDFYPDIAFKVEDKILITASLTCDLWKFETEGLSHASIHDLDNAHDPMVDLAVALFPSMIQQELDTASYNNVNNEVIADLNLEIEAREETEPKPEIIVEPQEEAVPSPITYKVIKGDNLTKIANKYAVTIKELMEWNQKKTDLIKIDEELIVKYK